MRRLGTVSHYAKQGFLIVRCERAPALNSKVFDKELKAVGVVRDVFGPVSSPYVAVKPVVKNPEAYVGSILYVDDRRSKDSRHGRNKGRRSSRRGGKRPAPKRRG